MNNTKALSCKHARRWTLNQLFVQRHKETDLEAWGGGRLRKCTTCIKEERKQAVIKSKPFRLLLCAVSSHSSVTPCEALPPVAYRRAENLQRRFLTFISGKSDNLTHNSKHRSRSLLTHLSDKIYSESNNSLKWLFRAWRSDIMSEKLFLRATNSSRFQHKLSWVV